MPDSQGKNLVPEGGYMATTIFLLLNGMGVVFLLYVLVNFWKEGHRPKNSAWRYSMERLRSEVPNVLVVTHPISHSARGGVSVIPIQERRRSPLGSQDYRTFADETNEMPVKTKQFSTR